MKAITQDKFVKYAEDGVTMTERGNCFAACIASLVEVPLNYVPNIEELFECYPWFDVLCAWLEEQGFEFISSTKDECEKTDRYYMVSGKSPRGNFNHIVIYQYGKMIHDPHPDHTGILTEEIYEYLEKIK